MSETGVYDAFAEKLVVAVKKLKVGNGFEPGVLQGPLIDQAAVEKVEEHIQDAVSQGARVIPGRKSPSSSPNLLRTDRTGWCHSSNESCSRRDFRSPSATALFRFETDEEAINMANDTEFGLASYFYSRDTRSKFGELLKGSSVEWWALTPVLSSTEVAPFGGVKQWGCGSGKYTLWYRGILGGEIPLFRRP